MAPTHPPSAAPIGRDPVLTVRNTGDTRPSIVEGVTLYRRSVVDVIDQPIGPAPNRKNEARRARPDGTNSVETITPPPHNGDRRTELNGAAERQPRHHARGQQRAGDHARAVHASVTPTACAPSPSARTAYGT